MVMLCTVDGCDRPMIAKNLCKRHYYLMRRNGDPTLVKRTPSPAMDWLRAHVSHVGKDCLIWPFYRTSGGYAHVYNGICTSSACRVMCTLAHGEPPTPDHQAAHQCGRGADGCIHPDHLYWATCSENHLDKHLHGTMPFGESHPGSKLNDLIVREVRRRVASGETQQSVADDIGVSQSMISAIHLRKFWRHIQ